MSESFYLFYEGDLYGTLENLKVKLNSQISSLQPSQLLAADISQVCAHFVSEFTLLPLVLHEESMELVEPREVTVQQQSYGGTYDRTVLEFRFEIPFEGDENLFRCKPSQFDLNPPKGFISKGHLVFTFCHADRNNKAIESRVNEFIRSVKIYIERQSVQIEAWQHALPGRVNEGVSARRTKLLADKQLVDDLGFRIRRRGDSSATNFVPIHRKAITPPLPPAKSGPLAKAEPALDMAVYEEILETLAGMSVVMERNPSAFGALDEEALRTHFLVPLNSKFQGMASGETFNAAGKTDILIKHGDRILFIAECKFWKGAQSLADAIGQLLSYLTWRETKAAILLFNRNRNFSGVLAQIPGIFSIHPQFVRQERYEKSTGFRFLVRHPEDKSRHLLVTLLAFDVPTTEGKA